MILRIVVFLGIILFVEGQAPTVQISLGGTGSTASQGRVDITRNGIRGTVCNDRFTDLAAAVVCRQLNYANGGTAVTDGRFGPGTGPIWLDDVECQGNELHIEQCISRPWNESNCGHDEDVGVVCNVSPIASSSVSPATTRAPATVQPSNCTVPSPNIRLVGPSNLRGIGFVEVRRNGVWGSICDDQWGRDDAKVVCRMLCYDPNIAQAGAPVDINHVSDQVSNNYLLDNVECVGTETDIEQCPRANQIDCDATVHEYASVTCVRLLNNQPQAPVPELECTSGRFYARFSRTQDPNLEAKHLSIFYPFNGPCNIEKPTTTDTVSIVIPYGQCGTVTTYNATHIFYTNSIKYDYTVIENQIVRVNTYRIEASCEFPRDYDSNEGYTPLTETVTQKAPGRFIIDMTFFNDSFVTPLNGSIQLTLGEWLNVALTLEAVDPNLKLIVPNCKATPTSAPNDPTFFDLFHNKCANDPTLGFFPLNSTVFGFRYQTFKFVSFSNVIIQCDAFVCLVSEKNAECDRTCNTTSTSGTGRRKRDTSGRDIYRVVSQPMKFQQHGDGVVIDRGDGWEVNLVTTRAATTATTLNAMPTSQSTTSKGSSVPSTTPKATTKVTEVKTSTTVQSATSLSSSTVPTTTPQQTSTTLQTTTAQPMTMSSTIPTTGKISLTSAQTTLSPTTTTATNRHPSSTSISSLKSSSTDNKQPIGTTLAAKEEPTSSTEKQHVPKPKELYVGGLGGLSILSGSGTLHYYLFINILSLLFLYIIHSVI